MTGQIKNRRAEKRNECYCTDSNLSKCPTSDNYRAAPALRSSDESPEVLLLFYAQDTILIRYFTGALKR